MTPLPAILALTLLLPPVPAATATSEYVGFWDCFDPVQTVNNIRVGHYAAPPGLCAPSCDIDPLDQPIHGGFACFGPGEIQVYVQISDDVFSPMAGRACQDSNGDGITCDGLNVAFCGSVYLEGRIDPTLPLTVFIGGPILNLQQCGQAAFGTRGFVTGF